MKPVRFIALLALALLMAAPALAQTTEELVKMQQQLMTTMAREAPLTNEDLRTYLTHAEAIYRLRYEPDKLGDVVRAIDPWTEARFAYVTTKLSVGMFMLMRSDDPRSRSLPEFAKPTEREMELIRRYEDDLTRTMRSLQAKYAPGS